jgi:hypothetical protein
MLEDKTPLRDTDRVRSESREKKSQLQLKQGNKMICAQARNIKKLGAAPGSAVVVRRVDPSVISHAIGIVGIVYQIPKGGGARVATILGNLSNGSMRGHWWVSADQYKPKFQVDENVNINPKLDMICQQIISFGYNKTMLQQS